MEQRRNARAEETGDPGVNLSTIVIIWHDAHVRKSKIVFAFAEGERSSRCPTAAPESVSADAMYVAHEGAAQVMMLKASNTTRTETSLTWDSPDTLACAKHYKLYHCAYDGAAKEDCVYQTKIFSLNRTSFKLGGLQSCKNNHIWLATVDKYGGESNVSIVVHTGDGRPPKVCSVTTTSNRGSTFDVSWLVPADFNPKCHAGYRVCFASQNDGSGLCSFTTTNTYIARRTTACTNYTVNVQTVDGELRHDSHLSAEALHHVFTLVKLPLIISCDRSTLALVQVAEPAVPQVRVDFDSQVASLSWPTPDNFSASCLLDYEVVECVQMPYMGGCKELHRETLPANTTVYNSSQLPSCATTLLKFSLVAKNKDIVSIRLKIISTHGNLQPLTNLTVVSANTKQMTLAWTPSDFNACTDHYRVCWQLYHTKACKDTTRELGDTFTNILLVSCHTYSVRIFAVNKKNYSESITADMEIGRDTGKHEVSMELRDNERVEEMGDSRKNPLASGIVRHDSHLRKSGVYQPTSRGLNPVRLTFPRGPTLDCIWIAGPENVSNQKVQLSPTSALVTWSLDTSAHRCSTGYSITWCPATKFSNACDGPPTGSVTMFATTTRYDITGLETCAEYFIIFQTLGRNDSLGSIKNVTKIKTPIGKLETITDLTIHQWANKTVSLDIAFPNNTTKCITRFTTCFYETDYEDTEKYCRLMRTEWVNRTQSCTNYTVDITAVAYDKQTSNGSVTFVTVTWEPPKRRACVVSYRMCWSAEGTDTSCEITFNNQWESSQYDSLLSCTKYTVSVAALDRYARSSENVTATFHTGAAQVSDVIPNVSPSGKAVTVTWTFPESNVRCVSYHVVSFIRAEDNLVLIRRNVSKEGTRSSYGGLFFCNSYKVEVQPITLDDESPPAVTALFHTPSNVRSLTGLSVTGIKSDALHVSYTIAETSSNCVHHFQICWEARGVNKSCTNEQGYSSSSVNITGLTPATNYTVEVTPVAPDGQRYLTSTVSSSTLPSSESVCTNVDTIYIPAVSKFQWRYCWNKEELPVDRYIATSAPADYSHVVELPRIQSSPITAFSRSKQEWLLQEIDVGTPGRP
ncbi:hypothetical protein PR048_027371 [Dryococelus australis]|uniref:Fibronectin type-III domain-containing protein n=1 Tax=Dryococelus australis TaxID=614101 RepID=A0ABQ9GFN7_9NEOP|nr:hypothetical protein PR048_027371 [Dryococelus australis]